MRKVLVSILAVGLVVAAVLLPERLSLLSDRQILDNAQIFSPKKQEGFAESVQLTVAEKLLMLRSGTMDLLELDEDPVEITGQTFAVTGGKVESSKPGIFEESSTSIYDAAGEQFWWEEFDGENVLVDGENGEIISEEAVKEAVQKWEGRISAVYRELRGLQSLGGLPILWSSSDTVECSGMREYVVIDPATQVNFSLYRLALSCSPYELTIWVESQSGRILAFNIYWNSGMNLTWSRNGGSSFGGAWRSYWGMDGVDGSWYLQVHDILDATANPERINGDYAIAGSVNFSYDETSYASALKCYIKPQGGNSLSWNSGLL